MSNFDRGETDVHPQADRCAVGPDRIATGLGPGALLERPSLENQAPGASGFGFFPHSFDIGLSNFVIPTAQGVFTYFPDRNPENI